MWVICQNLKPPFCAQPSSAKQRKSCRLNEVCAFVAKFMNEYANQHGMGVDFYTMSAHILQRVRLQFPKCTTGPFNECIQEELQKRVWTLDTKKRGLLTCKSPLKYWEQGYEHSGGKLSRTWKIKRFRPESSGARRPPCKQDSRDPPKHISNAHDAVSH